MKKLNDNIKLNDILQTSEGDKVLVIGNNTVKVLLDDEDFDSKNSNKEEGFFMNLDNFIQYNSFYIIGNKNDKIEGSRNLIYEKSRGINQIREVIKEF